MFTTSRLWISDVKTDFLRAFEDEWIGWDGGRSRTGHDDCLDAVYWTCYIGQSHLMPNKEANKLPVYKTIKASNPFNSLGDAHANVELFSINR